MAPEVTVVIPTRDRPAGLAAALDALRAQTLDPGRFEVVVVDDGSSPPAVASAGGLDVRVVRHDAPRGPAAARNAGWRAARGGLVAFTDDDCTPAPGWLAALIAASGADERVVVQGPIAPRPDQRQLLGPLSHTLDVAGPSRYAMTANIAYPRALLERLGGFDEWFRRACGEDVELGARAAKAGAVTRFAPDALVHHEVRRLTLRQHLRHAAKWGDAARALALHPELRDLLTARLFFRPSHPVLLLALAGLVLRRPLLAIPYALDLRARHGGDLRAAGRAAPLHAAIDAAEVATLAAASIRHRTPIL
jgi:glycosyltransferase involved in cell wall biosynthesis